jgi:hypothetical protein
VPDWLGKQKQWLTLHHKAKNEKPPDPGPQNVAAR